MALVGDLREVLEELLPRVGGRDGSAWLKTIEASKGESRCATSRICRTLGISTRRM